MDKTRASLSRSARGRCSFPSFARKKQRPSGTWERTPCLCGINNADKATHGSARGWTGAASACISCSCHFCFPPSIVETLQRGRPCGGRGGGAGPRRSLRARVDASVYCATCFTSAPSQERFHRHPSRRHEHTSSRWISM